MRVRLRIISSSGCKLYNFYHQLLAYKDSMCWRKNEFILFVLNHYFSSSSCSLEQEIRSLSTHANVGSTCEQECLGNITRSSLSMSPQTWQEERQVFSDLSHDKIVLNIMFVSVSLLLLRSQDSLWHILNHLFLWFCSFLHQFCIIDMTWHEERKDSFGLEQEKNVFIHCKHKTS